jgi:hyperosmotically inducible protein
MLKRYFKHFVISCLTKMCVLAPIASTLWAQDKPQIREASFRSPDRDARIQSMIVAAVRHQLFTLPYYDVFDWLDAEVYPDGKVVLRGDVVRPTTKTDAEARVLRIESVTAVVNEINVLPPSPTDDALRVAVYRAIYNFNSPLFRYATRAMPPIHIVVNNGRAMLRGVVASQADSQLAYTAARNVSGLFDVKNELRVER